MNPFRKLPKRGNSRLLAAGADRMQNPRGNWVNLKAMPARRTAFFLRPNLGPFQKIDFGGKTSAKVTEHEQDTKDARQRTT